MDRLLRIAAYLANAVLIIGASILVLEARGMETYLAMLFLIPPVLSLLVIYNGPDLEERRLSRLLNKARMRKELEGLGKVDKSAKK